MMLTISENGLGRRTPIEQYRITRRGGKGIKNYDCDKKGCVAGVMSVEEDDDIILIAEDGMIIRTKAGQINIQSRYGSGVKVMTLGEGNKVVSFTKTKPVAEILEDEIEPSDDTETTDTQTQAEETGSEE
jgi:DNA gyrase subunit A